MDKSIRVGPEIGYNDRELEIQRSSATRLLINMKQVSWIATLLMVIGAINWGLVGLFEWNLVEAIFGSSTVAMIVYLLVGLSGIWGISLLVPKKSAMGSM